MKIRKPHCGGGAATCTKASAFMQERMIIPAFCGTQNPAKNGGYRGERVVLIRYAGLMRAAHPAQNCKNRSVILHKSFRNADSFFHLFEDLIFGCSWAIMPTCKGQGRSTKAGRAPFLYPQIPPLFFSCAPSFFRRQKFEISKGALMGIPVKAPLRFF